MQLRFKKSILRYCVTAVTVGGAARLQWLACPASLKPHSWMLYHTCTSMFVTVRLQKPAIPTWLSQWRLKVILIALIQYGPALGPCRCNAG